MTGATGVIAKALFRASGNLPCRIIADANGPYLERYYLATVFGIRFYIHRFVASDPGRGLHDHPLPWAGSVVLSGFYFEITRAGVRTVRWINGLVGDSFHRVVLPNEHGQPWDIEGAPVGAAQPCWTLFFHRARCVKPWGFLRPIVGDEQTNNAKTWIPYNFPGDGVGTDDPWWLKVPVGRLEPRRLGAKITGGARAAQAVGAFGALDMAEPQLPEAHKDAVDARRYRWLRNEGMAGSHGQREIVVYMERLPCRADQSDECLFYAELDQAIDAAMKLRTGNAENK